MINGDICNEDIGGQLPHLARMRASLEPRLTVMSDVVSTTQHEVHEFGIHDLQRGTAPLKPT